MEECRHRLRGPFRCPNDVVIACEIKNLTFLLDALPFLFPLFLSIYRRVFLQFPVNCPSWASRVWLYIELIFGGFLSVKIDMDQAAKNTTRVNDVAILAYKFNGQLVVSMLKKAWKGAMKSFKWAVVIKLATGESFNCGALSGMLKKVWEMPKGVTFEEIQGYMMVATFSDEQKLEKVLEEGPWLYPNQLILIKRREIGKRPEEMDFTKAQFWLQIHNAPLEIMDDDDIMSGMAKAAGRVVKESPDDQDVRKRKFRRFRVEVNINVPLEKGVYMRLEEHQGGMIWLEFKYE